MSTKININVNVVDKVASAIGAPTIVCGNSNYCITFTLDTEWETANAKTARFVYRRDGEVKYIDVAFTGRVVGVPELANIDEVYVGVYAGELYTSTPARIVCKKSIKCGIQKHEDPDPDVYREVLQAINNLDTLPTVTADDAGRALMVNEDGRWVVRLPNFIYDQNSGELIRFFVGTVAEWEAWDGDKNNVIFFPLDLNILDEVETAFDKLLSGELEVGKAKTAATAETAITAASAETAGAAMSAASAETAKDVESLYLHSVSITLNQNTDEKYRFSLSYTDTTQDVKDSAVFSGLIFGNSADLHVPVFEDVVTAFGTVEQGYKYNRVVFSNEDGTFYADFYIGATAIKRITVTHFEYAYGSPVKLK
jgi:hypothetical protein